MPVASMATWVTCSAFSQSRSSRNPWSKAENSRTFSSRFLPSPGREPLVPRMTGGGFLCRCPCPVEEGHGLEAARLPVGAEHLAQLFDATVGPQALHLRHRPAVGHMLADVQVDVGVGSDLGKMRNGKHLAVAGQPPPPAGGPPPHPAPPGPGELVEAQPGGGGGARPRRPCPP